jgi:hypothetical protein
MSLPPKTGQKMERNKLDGNTVWLTQYQLAELFQGSLRLRSDLANNTPFEQQIYF